MTTAPRLSEPEPAGPARPRAIGRRGGRGRVSGPGCRAPHALPGGALGKGGGSPSRPGAPVCAAQGQVRGRAEVSGSSRWAARSAAATLRPGRPQLAPRPGPRNPESPPAGNRGERALGAHGPRLLPDLGRGAGHRHPALALDSLTNGPGTQAADYLASAVPAAHFFLRFSRPGRNFLGHLSVSNLQTPRVSWGEGPFLGWAELLWSLEWRRGSAGGT